MRCKNITSRNNWNSNEGGPRYLPYAFTEQGIYMLMTVLKGELATKQSIALVKTFKQMKDYIVESNNLISSNELLKLINEQNNKFVTKEEFERIKNDTSKIKKELSKVMDNFMDYNKQKHYVFLKGQRLESDVFYQEIYSKAKHSIYIIDDYIDVKTLLLLKSSKNNIDIIIFTDNKGKNKITKEFINDFIKDSNMNIIFKMNKTFHDRYIIIDYGYKNEVIYHCGSSSKDSGNKTTAITIIEDYVVYNNIIKELLQNESNELIEG